MVLQLLQVMCTIPYFLACLLCIRTPKFCCRFTAAVAKMEHDLGYKNLGLVLLNSAGRILNEPGISTTPQDSLFLPYSGPNNFILGAFGKIIFSFLQVKEIYHEFTPLNSFVSDEFGV